MLLMATRPGKRKAQKQAAPPEEEEEEEEEEALSLDAAESTPSVQCARLSEPTIPSKATAD